MSAPAAPADAVRLRLATLADLPALREMIPRSVRALSQGFYTPAQIESAIRHVFGPDTALIGDGTYFVAELADSTLAGCGGWSRRRTLYGGDQARGRDPHAAGDDFLDPATDAAKVRAFFVTPGCERRGAATAILDACLEAARAAGFRRLELGATLPGVPFYLARGFTRDKVLDTTLPDGTGIAFIQMSATLDGLLATRPRPDAPAA